MCVLVLLNTRENAGEAEQQTTNNASDKRGGSTPWCTAHKKHCISDYLTSMPFTTYGSSMRFVPFFAAIANDKVSVGET